MHATAALLGMEIEAPDVEDLRREFRRLQDAADFVVGRSAWRVEVLRELARMGLDEGIGAGPAEWVAAAERARVACPHCGATGRYRWGAIDLATGKSAHEDDCYQCGGTGRQDCDDLHRNKAYWMHAIRAAAGF